MTTFTKRLQQQVRQQRLNHHTLARRLGLTATKVRLAVEQDAVLCAFAVRRLAGYFGVDVITALRSAADQAAIKTIAKTPLERELFYGFYIISDVERRPFDRELEAAVRARPTSPQAILRPALPRSWTNVS